MSKGRNALTHIRNVGCIAHVDHGKTTVTERMLHYSGVISRAGDVDDGDTVMDFMAQERERGITIGSAAITFPWGEHTFNLIDTPGHVDFTVEVERTLRVLDGAITILDGVAGVQAQTETVWRQASRYNVPRIALVNKMDREGACVHRAPSMMQSKLNTTPLPLQLPTVAGPGFGHLIDLVDLASVQWTDEAGMHMQRAALFEPTVELGEASEAGALVHASAASLVDADTAVAAVEARMQLVDTLASLDEQLMEEYMEVLDRSAGEAHAALLLSSQGIRQAVRRQTLGMAITPVLYGSALKNRGIQPVLDAAVHYLPSPADRKPAVARVVMPGSAVAGAGGSSKGKAGRKAARKAAQRAKTQQRAKEGDARAGIKRVERKADVKEPLCALVFKVVYDAQMGPISFFRVYSGRVKNGGGIQSIGMAVEGEEDAEVERHVERVMQLKQVQGQELLDVESIGAGNIGAAVGLKYARTGDTLIDAKDKQVVQLDGMQIPQAVFFCAIEPESSAEEKRMSMALEQLQREDPSFHVTQDEETGQTLISGMGELHLQVVTRRLLEELRVKARVGKMRIAYRETLLGSARGTVEFQRQAQNGSVMAASMEVVLKGRGGDVQGDEENEVEVLREWMLGGNAPGVSLMNREDTDTDKGDNGTTVSGEQMQAQVEEAAVEAIEEGLHVGLDRGPIMGFPLQRVHARVESVDRAQLHSNSSLGAVQAAHQACAVRAIRQLALKADPALLEPVVAVDITVPEAHMGSVIADLTSHRRGYVDKVHHDDSAHTAIRAMVPLKEMIGYSTHLRSVSQGTGAFTMVFSHYEVVGKEEQAKVERGA